MSEHTEQERLTIPTEEQPQVSARIWQRGTRCFLVCWMDHEDGQEDWEARTTLAAAKRWVEAELLGELVWTHRPAEPGRTASWVGVPA